MKVEPSILTKLRVKYRRVAIRGICQNINQFEAISKIKNVSLRIREL